MMDCKLHHITSGPRDWHLSGRILPDTPAGMLQAFPSIARSKILSNTPSRFVSCGRSLLIARQKCPPVSRDPHPPHPRHRNHGTDTTGRRSGFAKVTTTSAAIHPSSSPAGRSNARTRYQRPSAVRPRRRNDVPAGNTATVSASKRGATRKRAFSGLTHPYPTPSDVSAGVGVARDILRVGGEEGEGDTRFSLGVQTTVGISTGVTVGRRTGKGVGVA